MRITQGVIKWITKHKRTGQKKKKNTQIYLDRLGNRPGVDRAGSVNADSASLPGGTRPQHREARRLVRIAGLAVDRRSRKDERQARQVRMPWVKAARN